MYFDEKYTHHLEEIFPRDVLWAKKNIKGQFILLYADNIHTQSFSGEKDIFQESARRVAVTLPLSRERQKSLLAHIFDLRELSKAQEQFFHKNDDISRDPFFALVEDFSLDGDISKEEFLLLQESYDSKKDFIAALDGLPENIRNLFHSHIELALSHEHSEKRSEFESEYSQELAALKKRGMNIEPVVVFVSRNYYKTPGKYRKYEHPKRRLRRTFKLALLKLLRVKLWNIDAENILRRFEEWELFEDYFMILFKLLEVIDENPDGEEIYNILDIEEETQAVVHDAEQTKEKILKGESIITQIASLFSKAESGEQEAELEDGILDKLLDESTDIVGDTVYFNREEDEMAGVYAEGSNEIQEDEEENYENMSPHAAHEMLSHEFHKIEEEKRLAFAEGRYDDIDIYNDKLITIQSKLEKLVKVLGLVE